MKTGENCFGIKSSHAKHDQNWCETTIWEGRTFQNWCKIAILQLKTCEGITTHKTAGTKQTGHEQNVSNHNKQWVK